MGRTSSVLVAVVAVALAWAASHAQEPAPSWAPEDPALEPGSEDPEPPAPPVEPAPQPRRDEPPPRDGETPKVYSGSAQNPCLGQPIASVSLKGCEERTCREQGGPDRFLQLTDLRTGDILTAEMEARAIDRLRATGFFWRVSLRCRTGPSGIDVVLHAAANTFVRRVEIEGNETFRKTELKKRVFLRSGSILNVVPGLEDENEDVRRQIDSIQRFYRREGLEDVKIRVRARRIERNTVDLVLSIDEGEPARIRSVDISFHRREVPEGALPCPGVDQRTLKDLVGLETGDVVTSRELRRIRRRIETWFQSIGYVRPRVTAEAGGRPLTLTVRIETDRCWLLRLWQRDTPALAETQAEPSIRFRDPLGVEAEGDESGYERLDLEPWREQLPFGASGVFDRDEALRGVEAIQRSLQERGYLFADVVLEHRRAPREEEEAGTWGPVMGAVDYLITLNYERRIQGVILRGRRTFTEEELLDELDTGTWDALGEGGFVQVDRVLFDLEKLERFYRSRGFYDFRFLLRGRATDYAPVRAIEEKGPWLFWEYTFRDRGFRVRKRAAEMVVYLEIPFQEGPRTRLRHLTVSGNEALGDEQVRRLLGVRPGEPFGTWFLDEGVKAISRWYQSRGFHEAVVTATCDAEDPPPPGGDCSLVRSRDVDLVVAIHEGSRSVVGEVFYRGNFKTDPEVLLRDLPREGEPYSQANVGEASRRLRNLGVFNAVSVDRIGLDETPPRERVALVVAVEEAESRFLDLYAGFRTIDREADRKARAPDLLGSLVGQSIAASDRQTTGLGRPLTLSFPDVLFSARAEYYDRHFLGRGYRLALPVEVGTSTLAIANTNEFIDPFRVLSFVPTLDVPRVLDSDLNLQFEVLAELDRVNEQLDRTEFGVGSNLTWPVRPQMSVTLGARASMICFEEPPRLDEPDDPNAARVCADLGSLLPQVTPSIRWRWDTQDNPLNPRKGFALAAQTKYILAVDREGIETGEVKDFQEAFVNFVKWEVSAEIAREILSGPILAAFVRYGAALGPKDTLLPTNERFTLGGSNGMRGFADHAVGRYDENGELDTGILDIRRDGGGNVVLNGSFELRMPLLRQSGIWTAAFVDFGGLAKTHEELSSKSFRTSAGFGVRWLLGDQIPIRLDGAVVLDALASPRYLTWNEVPADDAGGCGAGDRTVADGAGGVRCLRGVAEDGYAFHVELLYPF